MTIRDTILTVNIVEPALVQAVQRHSKEMGIKLRGVVLIDRTYAEEALERDFPRDKTGVFEEVFCDFDDPDELQRILKVYNDRLLAVTCRYENSMHSFRKLIPFVPYLPAPSESSLLWSLEKPMMRDRLSNYNRQLTPKYQYIEETDIPNVFELIKDFNFPVIVKPSELAESLLVTRCETKDELSICLINTFQVIGDIFEREHRENTPGVLIEEFMEGTMYSTDAYITSEGEIYCLPLVEVVTAHSIGLPGFYSYRHIIPVGLPEGEVEKAFEVSRAAIRALNLRATSTHIELFLTPQGWKIIEVGARIGGYRGSLYREAYGIDHFYNDLAIHMGNKPTMPGAPIKHAAGFNIYADDEGIIESIEGIEEAQQLTSVVFVEPHAEPGDEALFAQNGGRYVVDGILSNTDPDQLEKDMAKIREIVKINVRSTDHHTNATTSKKLERVTN
ncbi:ATP-grasp domain-containing protein [Patescibacteria group bacterium]|nr:MAG: ATP-grasp domain-containing protein [Patescibacteria group bacterium]